MNKALTNEVVGDVLAALYFQVLERHQVTEQEWMAAPAFLTEIDGRTSSSCSPTRARRC